MLESSLENKSRNHFLQEICRPSDRKSLKLRTAAFEMQFIVLGSPFKRPPIICAKTVYSLLGESTHNLFLAT